MRLRPAGDRTEDGQVIEMTLGELVTEQEWTSVRESLGLSPRQAQVVEGLLQAKGDKQIAQDIGISVPTVRTYLDRLFQKLDVDDRVELVVHVFGRIRAASGTGALQRDDA